MNSKQENLRSSLRTLLALPEKITPATGMIKDEQIDAGIVRTELMLDDIPGTFLHPEGPGPFPTILYCHAHGGEFGLGRLELTQGAWWLSAPPAPDLLAAGFAVLCIDMPCFGDRQSEGNESELSKALLWQGLPLFGRMIQDLTKALGWLCAQPEVDADCIATLGVSMGAAHAYWLAALDSRVAATAHICMLADIAPLIESGTHDRHGHYLTVPGLLNVAESGDIAGSISPRPQFIAHGETDLLTPAKARDAALTRVRKAYEQTDTLETFLAPDSGHTETPDMRKAVLNFLIRACIQPKQEKKTAS